MLIMGVFIYTEISESVKQDVWENVYEESYELAKKFNLCDLTIKKIGGIDIVCYGKIR